MPSSASKSFVRGETSKQASAVVPLEKALRQMHKYLVEVVEDSECEPVERKKQRKVEDEAKNDMPKIVKTLQKKKVLSVGLRETQKVLERVFDQLKTSPAGAAKALQ
eukprot:CAMPEP_0170481564 /NCGR_PEP_ID=MMETSP0208-20121228/1967_1 /TAXON_ID=197538 /ORGANISM="Strombidium inclinatum, Strain S3" /LENGTH=106 /DNA_ID=CAMNT_0010754297 /DNA_START=107 /DNA_END=427 /DNA_ORIENTATION=-